jgi:hypothetical protein
MLLPAELEEAFGLTEVELSLFGTVSRTLLELLEGKVVVLGVEQRHPTDAVNGGDAQVQLIVLPLYLVGRQVVL